jgi:hypothetical protein
MSGKNKAKYKKLAIGGETGSITVYASPRILAALGEATVDLDLYQGVRLGQVLDAVYAQGKKDGRSEMAGHFSKFAVEAEKALPFKNPGRPKKSK